MEDYKTEMGRRIKQHRNTIGLTQEELAERLGVSVKHLSETERGISGLSIDNLLKLCGLFGVTLDQLIRGETGGADRWELLLPRLRTVAPEKEETMDQLILGMIDLSK